jgi:transposase
MNTITAWLGIDVSKDKLDAALNLNGQKRAKVFTNDTSGWRHLCAWLQALGLDRVHACLEATGRYGEGIALALHAAGHGVSIINPAQIKYFARTKLGRNKTDKVDAALIGEYGRLFVPALWSPPPPALRQLRDLVRTREAVMASLQEWRNRHNAGPLATGSQTTISGIIDTLERELAALEQAIDQTIATDAVLRTKSNLLISIPGIGRRTAATLLCELPGPDVLKTAREVAAYAGLNPSHSQSGSSVKRSPRLSRIGNAALRTALYFPAITALRLNPAVAALGDRLKAQARLRPMQIIAAAMRKLLHVCHGVLKTGQPFDPAWPKSASAATSRG